ncbi:MAG: DUF262 domain-containing protein [Dehalococcoidia bacterium]|nr:DUF262 domain-containing protein [Dehalococcoidia bacterium]
MGKTDTTVGQLVDMIQRGELRLPELQRRYVWTDGRVRDLFDSLYREYPSGTILVWENDHDVPTRDLAVPQESLPFRPKLLLDGQQRLTSLTAAISGKPIKVKNRVRPVNIAFNLGHPEGPPTEVSEVEGDEPTQPDDVEEDTDDRPGFKERLQYETFVVASGAILSDPRWVKLSDIFSEKGDWQLVKQLVESPEDPKYDLYVKRLQRVRAIRNYPYVMQVLDRSLSYEEVAEIFVRVNSLGMKLRGSDLALAQMTARWQNSLRLFEEFVEECEKVWFTFDLGLLVKTVVVFATKQSRFRATATIPVPKLEAAWEEAKQGLRFAINFLRANAGIEDESLLSSPYLVIPIAVLAVLRKGNLSEEESRGLLRWLFVANAKGHFSGSTESTMDADLAVLFRGEGPNELLELLKQQFGRLTFERGDFVGRGVRNPLFPAIYLALKRHGAKDWISGLALSLSHQGKSHPIHFHHIFPKSIATQAGYSDAEVNEIANMAFISGQSNRSISNKEPAVYLPGILETKGAGALEGQKIPTDSDLWKTENFRTFLEFRRADLAKVLNDFIEEVGSDGKHSVDVADLVAAGEGPNVEFKRSARYNQETKMADKAIEAAIVKAIAGFMNHQGGCLLIGVNDAGLPVGIARDLTTIRRQDVDGYQQCLINLVRDFIGREFIRSISVTFPEADGHQICVVDVVPSPRPAYVKDGKEERFFLRSGNTTQPLSMAETVQYVADHWGS